MKARLVRDFLIGWCGLFQGIAGLRYLPEWCLFVHAEQKGTLALLLKGRIACMYRNFCFWVFCSPHKVVMPIFFIPEFRLFCVAKDVATLDLKTVFYHWNFSRKIHISSLLRAWGRPIALQLSHYHYTLVAVEPKRASFAHPAKHMYSECILDAAPLVAWTPEKRDVAFLSP